MEISLYFNDIPDYIDLFTGYLNMNTINYNVSSFYRSKKVMFNITEDRLEEISLFVTDLIFDFYLKEILISKLYDEYYVFNTKLASLILIEISHKLPDIPMNNDVRYILCSRGSLNLESYFLFCGKKYTESINKLTDDVIKCFVYQ